MRDPNEPSPLSGKSVIRQVRFATTGSPEVALNQKVNQKVKNLIQKLGEAIHESVSESEDIAGVVKDIREQGFDVLLMLEATIGLNEVDEESGEAGETSEPADGPFTYNDLSFLKSLRISLSDSDASPDQRRALPSSTSEDGLRGDGPVH
jgi:uncharacterized protein (UPF0335 family)